MFLRRLPTIQDQRGSALTITLMSLVLISIIVLAFFTRSHLNRQISFSSAGQYRVDLVADTAMDTIVGDLRSEMVAGSTGSSANSYTIYVPTTNAAVVPCRIADQSFPNVVKMSASGSNFWNGACYNSTTPNPARSGSNNSTAAASLNGRYIDSVRWNAPYLLGPTLPAGFTSPDWVVITRQGAITDASKMPLVGGSNGLANKSTANPNYAVGRYAYVIYDEGGLLDVNVAGAPPGATVPADFTTKRGVLPQVDITTGIIPSLDGTSATKFLQWRNQASASSYGTDVLSATNGFTTTFAPGDQVLVSRQDLIHYAANSGLSTSALQYLGTFSREINAPSYTPPTLGSANRPGVSGTTYGAAASVVGYDNLFNPSLINSRVTTSFTRKSDGTTATVGEPLIKYRFPLSRLALVTHTATGDTTSDIYNYFGLTRSSASDPWIYRSGTNAILTLSAVAAAGREPDFFELLQAAIQVGSLGKGSGNFIATVLAGDNNTYYQIMQIGANLISQYTTDSYPTRVSFDSTEFDGIENLPYLYRVFEYPYRFHGSPTIGIWYQPEVWNPHAGASSSPSAPSQFRFTIIGGTNAYAQFYGTGVPAPTAARSPLPPLFTTSPGITFTSSDFSTPVLLQYLGTAGADASGPNDHVVDGANNFIGICLGKANAPETNYQIDSVQFPVAYDRGGAHPSGVLTFALQYSDAGQWVTYSQFRYIRTGGDESDGSNKFQNYYQGNWGYCATIADPRSDRFGALNSWNVSNFQNTARTDGGNGYWAMGWQGSITAGEWLGWTNPAPGSISGGPGSNCLSIYPGCLSDNLSTSASRYVDCDGVLRPADGAYTTGIVSTGGYPQATDAVNKPFSRPVILNRAFRSVAEMGYAFRGTPWKHLDFFTQQSADAALLDLFCLNESPPPPMPAQSTEPVAQAGRLNLNTRQQPVLQAVLAGAIKAEDATTPISSTEANTLATNLVTLTSASPLLNRSELVTRWISQSNIAYTSGTDTNIKRRREAAIRALADIGNTRTWNLLIDVIAQSGRYAPSASTLNQFTVEGERRYWLHVAIDRYTGKVVSKFLEPVYE